MEFMDGSLFCTRCDGRVTPIRPWRGWKPCWHAWKVGVVLAVVLFPLLASDYCVMLPCTMLYLAAGGPLRSYAREKPVCSRCSLDLDEATRRPGTKGAFEAGQEPTLPERPLL